MLRTVFAFSAPLRVLGITGMQTLWISLKQVGGLRMNLKNIPGWSAWSLGDLRCGKMTENKGHLLSNQHWRRALLVLNPEAQLTERVIRPWGPELNSTPSN